MKQPQTLLLALALTFSSPLWSHPGGVDTNGGHFNRSTGEYHCHREKCSDVAKQVEDATTQAITEGRAFSEIYSRKDYAHWSDEDGDCMNTRHEVLLASSLTTPKLSPDGCYVSSGQWIDPYSSKTLRRASELDIDHIVPLKWAHEHGASNWPKSKKSQFANDPLNLLAVDDSLNQRKGAKGLSEWLPPNTDFHCQYLQLWLAVTEKYQLTMEASDRAEASRLSQKCEPN